MDQDKSDIIGVEVPSTRQQRVGVRKVPLTGIGFGMLVSRDKCRSLEGKMDIIRVE